jgi:hypothetical protein
MYPSLYLLSISRYIDIGLIIGYTESVRIGDVLSSTPIGDEFGSLSSKGWPVDVITAETADFTLSIKEEKK